MSFWEFIREAMSEKGAPSSKRVMGTLMLLVVMACLVSLVVKNGATVEVSGLLSSAMWSACALIGLGSVTSIFKK